MSMTTKAKTTLLAGGSVTAVLILLLLIFNIGIHHQIDDRARQAIESSLSDDWSASASYYAEWIYLPENEDELDPMYLSKTDKVVIDWCEKHTVGSEIQQCRIGNGRYFLKMVKDQDDVIGNYTYIAYVNIAGELQTVRRMNLLFLLAALITGFAGSLIGYRIGSRLEENEASQKMFFENASHELKTPLTVIRGYAEGLEKNIIPDQVQTGQVIQAQVDKMSSLVENILLLARIEAEVQPLHKEILRMDAFVEDCLLPLEEIIAAKEISVKLNLSPASVSADPDQMDCAITNLLMNAVRYSHGEIRVLCDERHLVIWNSSDPIPAEDVTYLFDRFHTGSKGSTGIGLALAKEIIERHEFQIRAGNENGGFAIEIDF